jgi:hypothetical protein
MMGDAFLPLLLANGGFDLVAFVLRLLHLLSAVTLGGGILFLVLVLMPALSKLDAAVADQIRAAARSRWAALIGVCTLLLLATGMYNYIVTVKTWEMPKVYHMLFGIKFVLALVVMFLASLLAGKTALAQKLQAKASTWGNVLVLLIVLIIGLAVAMRLSHNDRKPKAEAARGVEVNCLVAPVLSL